MEGMNFEEGERSDGKKERKFVLAVIFVCLALAAGVEAYILLEARGSKGYEDYTVQKEQYYVEYSDQYDYWDVLTVEYPRLEGIGGEQEKLINRRMYDTAMDRVNYWHLEPDEEVRELQEDYSVFSSDVHCDVTYHSQYLLSVEFKEMYAPVNPVYYVYYTKRGLNMDLMTGEVYELADILFINEDFAELWCRMANRKYGDELPYDEKTRGYVLSWFLGDAGGSGESYECRPFFYITQRKELAVGLAMDPKPAGLAGSAPEGNVYSVILSYVDVEPYRTESEFWDKYRESENAGRVLECLDLKENLWLGEDAGVWEYWMDR